MNNQELTIKAAQGHSDAITAILNLSLEKNKITVKCQKKGNILYTNLEGVTIKNQSESVEIVVQELEKLQIEALKYVIIVGVKNEVASHYLAEKIVRNHEKKKGLKFGINSFFDLIKSKKTLLLSITSLLLIGGGGYIYSLQTLSEKKSSQNETIIATEDHKTIKEDSKPIVDKNQTITIKAVGDMVPGTKYSKIREIKQKMLMFDNVKEHLGGADILFGNFESTLTNHPYSAKDDSQPNIFAFRTAPSYGNLIKSKGFDVLSIANNHSFDYGEKGFTDTMENIKKSGLEYVGEKNQILYVEKKGMKIAFIGFSTYKEHNSLNDLESGIKLVKEAKQKANVVVISFHGGAEGTNAMNVRNKTEIFYGENRGNLVLFARTMIDNGADLVLGHGPHVVRAMELYKGKLIAYSLGNFLGDGALSTSSFTANSMILEVKLNGEGNFVNGNIIPVKINNLGVPTYDGNLSSIRQVQNLTKSDFPQTSIMIDKKGGISNKN
ncbi:MAG TPA: CapA family protein [Allocoleopsis sp.]